MPTLRRPPGTPPLPGLALAAAALAAAACNAPKPPRGSVAPATPRTAGFSQAAADATPRGGSAAYRTLRPDVPYPGPADEAPRVLCVVAHPDDELAFGATLFKTATMLRGHVELAVLTNGEGGYKYTTLGELLYGRDLTDPAVGRRELPAIRQQELLEAARLLGIRRLHLFDQQDHRFTLDPDEVLAPDAGVWDLARIRAGLRDLLDRGRFDFVLTHLPIPTVHGHHKAATVLALEAIEAMPPDARPVPLGAFGAGGREEQVPRRIPDVLPGHPISRFRLDLGPWEFDRTTPFGFGDRLDYEIVVNWAIAAHKSQGTYQKLMGRWTIESYRVYALEVPRAVARVERWFDGLARPQFPTPLYDDAGELLEVLPPGEPPASGAEHGHGAPGAERAAGSGDAGTGGP